VDLYLIELILSFLFKQHILHVFQCIVECPFHNRISVAIFQCVSNYSQKFDTSNSIQEASLVGHVTRQQDTNKLTNDKWKDFTGDQGDHGKHGKYNYKRPIQSWNSAEKT